MMIVSDEQVKQQWYDHLTNDYELQAIILAHYLAEGDNRPDYDEAQCDFDSEHYLVYTDEEADEAVRENIEEMVWAFTPSFLSWHTGVDEEVFEALADRCEDNNDSFKRMIKDFDAFVEDAVRGDGRGHFLAGYDHEEHYCDWQTVERKDGKYETVTTEYYIYRRN